MIVPVRLSIKNFALIKEASIDFDNPDLFFVLGKYVDNSLGETSNGAGKSTFLNALWFALSGATVQNINYSDMIGPYGKSMHTIIDLKGPRDYYTLSRKRDGHNHTILFKKNGRPITARNNKLLEEKIAEELGLDWKVFRATNYIPQEDSKSGFIYATDRERKEIITRLYQKNVFDRALKYIKKEIKRQKKEYEETFNKLAKACGSLETSRDQLVSVTDKIIRAKKKNEETLKDDGQEREKVLKDLSSRIRKLSEQQVEIEEDIKASRKELEEVYEGTNKIQKECEDVTREIYAIEARMDEQEGSIGRLKEATLRKEDNCPECLQPLTTEARLELRNKIQEHIDAYNELLEKKESLVKTLEGLHFQKKKILENEASPKEDYISDKLIETNEIYQKLIDLRTKVEKIQDKESKTVDIEDMVQIKQETEASISALEETTTALQTELDERSDALEKWEVAEEAYAHELRSMAFESVVDDFTGLVQQKLYEIYGANLRIKVDAKSEDREGNITDKFIILAKDKDANDWKNALLLSGGQKKLLSMAISLAMMEMSQAKLGLVLLDEALENVDPISMANSIRALRNVAMNNVTLFVTHDNSVVPDGDRTIIATRSGGEIQVS